ncbi:MAG: hypothetical protein IKE65_01320, partial [Clostridia bacterium]|nr:hypothetical protein [Clostridia bacterium]
HCLALAKRLQYRRNYLKNIFARGASQFWLAYFALKQGKTMKECCRIEKRFNAVLGKKRQPKPVRV